MPLARRVGRAANGRHGTSRAVSGFAHGFGRAHFVDALAQASTRLIAGERCEEKSDRCAHDRAEHEAEGERPEDCSIGVATDSAADLGLSFAEQLTRALGRLTLQVVHDILKVFHAHHDKPPPALVKRESGLCRADATVACRSAGRPRERGLDEWVDVAAEHADGVADLDTGAVVLHQRVGVEDVGADLATPVGGAHLAPLLRLRLFLLTHLPLEEARAKDLHRGFLVLTLRTLVLAGDHDSRRRAWIRGAPP